MALSGVCRAKQLLRILQFSKNSCNFMNDKTHKIERASTLYNTLHCKYHFTEKKPKVPGKPNDTSEEKPKSRKKLISPEITLILPEENVSTMTLDQAEKLAKRRNHKLVKILDFDSKSKRPMYKLMTIVDYFKEDPEIKELRKKAKNNATKEIKLLTLSSKIDEHDLSTKTKQIIKFIKKNHSIRIHISVDGNTSKAEEILTSIKEQMKNISTSTNEARKQSTYQILFNPLKETENNSENKTDPSNNESEKKKVNKIQNT